MNDNHGQNPIQDSRLCTLVRIRYSGLSNDLGPLGSLLSIRPAPEDDRSRAFEGTRLSSRDSSGG